MIYVKNFILLNEEEEVSSDKIPEIQGGPDNNSSENDIVKIIQKNKIRKNCCFKWHISII